MNQRGRTPFPAVAGSAPSRTALSNNAAARGEAGRGVPVLHTGLAGPQGPASARPPTAGPAPAPPRRGAWKWTPAAPGRARTYTPRAHAGHPPRMVREPRHPGGSGTLDSGCEAAGNRGMGSMPPAQSGQQVRARRLPDSAAAPSPWRAALRLSPLPPPPERPRLPPAGLAGGPADSAPPSPAPVPRSRLAPRPGHARWSTGGFRSREGAVPARQRRPEGGREEGAPLAPRSSPRSGGSWVPRPPRPNSHFTDRETEGRSACPFAARLLRAGRVACQISLNPAPRTPSTTFTEEEIGTQRGKATCSTARSACIGTQVGAISELPLRGNFPPPPWPHFRPSLRTPRPAPAPLSRHRPRSRELRGHE